MQREFYRVYHPSMKTNLTTDVMTPTTDDETEATDLVPVAGTARDAPGNVPSGNGIHSLGPLVPVSGFSSFSVGGPASVTLVLPALFSRDSQDTIVRAVEFFDVALANPKTRVQYQNTVKAFCQWASSKGATSIKDIQPIHVARFIEERKQQVAAPTVKAELAALRSWFNYLTSGGQLTHNPAASVKGPRHSRAEGKTPGMNGAEAGKLLSSIKVNEGDEGNEEHPVDRLKALRDKAMISLMLYSACRVGAVCNTQVGDFYQTGTHYVIVLNEKGGKERTLALHHKAAEAIHAWIEAAGIKNEPKTPLFRSMPNQLRRQAKPFSDRGMAPCDAWDMVKARCRAAGLSPRFANHSFRVTALTNLLENGGTLDDAQRLAGHADARTTALYDRRSRTVMRSTVERINYD